MDLEGVARGMDGHCQPHLDEVDGAGNDWMLREEAARVATELLDVAKGLSADGVEVGEGVLHGGEAVSGEAGLGADDGAGAVDAALEDAGLAEGVFEGLGDGCCVADLGEQVPLGDGDVFHALKNGPAAAGGLAAREWRIDAGEGFTEGGAASLQSVRDFELFG